METFYPGDYVKLVDNVRVRAKAYVFDELSDSFKRVKDDTYMVSSCEPHTHYKSHYVVTLVNASSPGETIKISCYSDIDRYHVPTITSMHHSYPYVLLEPVKEVGQ